MAKRVDVSVGMGSLVTSGAKPAIEADDDDADQPEDAGGQEISDEQPPATEG